MPKLAVVTLIAAGTVFLYAYGESFSGGFLPLLQESAIGELGVLCLLVATRTVLTSYKGAGPSASGPSSSNPKVDNKISALGLVLALSTLLIPFPVGCNLTNFPYNTSHASVGCPMSPEGTWSSIWPNMAVLTLGFVLAGYGWGRGRTPKLSLSGLGMGMLWGGVAVLFLAYQAGYTTMESYFPLTSSAWWSLYLPDVVAGTLGVLLMGIGIALLLLRWPRRERFKAVLRGQRGQNFEEE